MTTKQKTLDTKKYNALIKKGKPIKIYCDEMCPVCGFEATYIEAKFVEGELILISTGCMACNWVRY
jgi:hypothetical protein